jgi:uncharacterized Fe-S cluster-containing radical SAM superfamily protein
MGNLNTGGKFYFDKIMVDLTTRCNLRCSVCYRAGEDREDIPFRELEGLSEKYRGKIVSLCGGEPTLREDLPEIIRIFSKNNTVFLITNGIKLSDRGYLAVLKESGLKYISFSFNGFSDTVYEKINGRPLLKEKLKALENLKDSGIKIILSVLLVKGLNEKELGRILGYCLENSGFIRELRVRSMVPLSKYLSPERYDVDTLLDIICEESGINKGGVLKELELKKRVNSFFNKEIFTRKSCSLDFHLRRKKGIYLPAGDGISAGFSGSGARSGIFLLMRGLREAYGPGMLAGGLLKSFLGLEKQPWVYDKGIFKVGLRSWPTGDNFNMHEIESCRTGYYLEGEELPFCYANILKSLRDDSRGS